MKRFQEVGDESGESGFSQGSFLFLNIFSYISYMTRINCGIPPKELTNKHLLAEHREIKRIPNAVKKGKVDLREIPSNFKLGKGHVKFFYDKLKYLHHRYRDIHDECLRRGFNVTCFEDAFRGLPDNLYNDYEPSKRDENIVRDRINDKLKMKKVCKINQ